MRLRISGRATAFSLAEHEVKALDLRIDTRP